MAALARFACEKEGGRRGEEKGEGKKGEEQGGEKEGLLGEDSPPPPP